MTDNYNCGYKLVTVIDEKYYSAVLMSQIFGVEYKLNERVSRDTDAGPLTVFTTRTAAFRFNKSLRTNSLIDQDAKVFYCYYKRSDDRQVWHRSSGLPLKIGGSYLPLGTEFADWVELKHEVLQ